MLTTQNQLQRILSIIQDLSDGRKNFTVTELAKRYSVTKRTIWRYINVLEEQLGFDIIYERERKRGRPTILHLAEGPLARPVFFNLDELHALYLTYDLFSCLEGTHIKESIDKLYDKIENDLSVAGDIKIVKDGVAMHLGPKRDYSRHKRKIKDISEAIMCCRKIIIDYKSPWRDQTEHFVLHPYLMVFYDNGLYIICFCEEKVEIRTFLLERIKRYEVLKGVFFKKQVDFSKDKYFEHSFGIITDNKIEDVKIKFSKNLSDYIKEKKWHSTARIKEEADGSIILSMQVCGKQEVLSWILKFGEDARLLEPKSWINELKEKINKMKQLYE